MNSVSNAGNASSCWAAAEAEPGAFLNVASDNSVQFASAEAAAVYSAESRDVESAVTGTAISRYHDSPVHRLAQTSHIIRKANLSWLLESSHVSQIFF